MDNIAEQLVKQSFFGKRLGILLGAAIGALVLCAAAYLLFPVALIPLFILCVMVMAFIISRQGWEVEYEVVNGDIQIDRIVAKEARHTLTRVRGDKIERLLPMKCFDTKASFDRTVIASSSKRTATWFFVYHSPKSGSTLVLFEPSDKVLSCLKKGLDRTVLLETERATRQKAD